MKSFMEDVIFYAFRQIGEIIVDVLLSILPKIADMLFPCVMRWCDYVFVDAPLGGGLHIVLLMSDSLMADLKKNKHDLKMFIEGSLEHGKPGFLDEVGFVQGNMITIEIGRIKARREREKDNE